MYSLRRMAWLDCSFAQNPTSGYWAWMVGVPVGLAW